MRRCYPRHQTSQGLHGLLVNSLELSLQDQTFCVAAGNVDSSDLVVVRVCDPKCGSIPDVIAQTASETLAGALYGFILPSPYECLVFVEGQTLRSLSAAAVRA